MKLKMERFEIKRRELHRSSSTGIPPTNKSAPYIIKIAGIVLVTGAILLVSHFAIGYKDLNEKINILKQIRAEQLIDQSCNEEVCLSRDCVSLASRIMTFMNLKAEPCEDFYEYACGGYAKTVFVPFGQTDYSPAEETQLTLFQNIRNIMESSENDNNSLTLQNMKQIYSSCTNTEQRDKQQIHSLNTWLREMELPLTEYQNDVTLELGTPGSWKTIVSKLEEYEIHTLFKATFKKSSTSPIEKIMVDCTLELFPPEVYLEASRENIYKLTLYKESLSGVLTLLSMGNSEKEEFMEEVLQMETNIVRAVLAAEVDGNYMLSEEEKIQIKEIWRPLIGDAMQDSDVINMCQFKLPSIIAALNQAPPRMAARYVLWRMLTQVVQYLGYDFRNLQLYYTGYLPFWKQLYGKNWIACAEVLRHDLGLASYKFLEEYRFITAQQLEKIKNVFSRLKSEVSQIIRSNTRLSRLTKKLLQNKLKTMQLDIGYSEIISNHSILDEIYKDLHTSDDYFLNVMNLKKFKTRHYFNQLWYSNSENSLVVKVFLEPSPLGVSFRYDYNTNNVRMDATAFRLPLSFYFGDLPNYMKFGETSMLARAITRAFDTTGSLIDANGRKWDKALLPQTIREEHTNFTECLMSQMSSSEYWFAEINNTEYINTIMADMGSFLVPYESFNKYLRNSTEEPILPGIALDRKQLYYVQVAQKYCEVQAPPVSSEENVVLSKRSRVNIAVSNMEDFASLFNCQPQQNLYLVNKCNLSS